MTKRIVGVAVGGAGSYDSALDTGSDENAGVDTTVDPGGGDGDSAATETAAASGTVRRQRNEAALRRFRRLALGLGLLGPAALVGWFFLVNIPPRALVEGDIVFRAAVDVLLALGLGVGCWYGLKQRDERAWTVAMAWGVGTLPAHLLEGALPWFLTAPFAAHWYVLGNVGVLLDAPSFFFDLSAVAVAGLTAWAGWRAHPDDWYAVAERKPAAATGTTARGSSTPGADAAPASATAGDGSGRTADREASAESPATAESNPTGSATGATAAAGSGAPDPASGDAAKEESDHRPTRQVATAGAGQTEAAPADAGAASGSDSDDETGAGAEAGESRQDDAEADGDAAPLAEHRAALDAGDPATRADAIDDVADAAADGAVPAADAADALADVLSGADDAGVRVAACEALGRIGTEDAREPLETARLDPDGDVSRAASRALRELEDGR